MGSPAASGFQSGTLGRRPHNQACFMYDSEAEVSPGENCGHRLATVRPKKVHTSSASGPHYIDTLQTLRLACRKGNCRWTR